MKHLNELIIERLKLTKDSKINHYQYFREFCIDNGVEKLLENGNNPNFENQYCHDGKEMLATIWDSFEMGFICPYKFKKWLIESNSKKLCCFEYSHNFVHQNINFNKIEDLLELKDKFKCIDKDSDTDYESDYGYDVECIKYEYKDQNDQFVYLLKYYYDFRYNRPFKKFDYFLIFDYDFAINTNENN